MYRRGVVTELDANTHRARVRFPDRDNVVSGWLDVLVRSVHGDKHYDLPPVGNQVACMLDERDEAGCIVGSVYSQTDAPEAPSEAVKRYAFADGAVVEYDPSSKVFRIDVPSGGTIELGGGAQPLALADDVKSELEALKAQVAAHTHQAGPALVSGLPGTPVTGVTGAPVAFTYSPGDVGSAKARSS